MSKEQKRYLLVIPIVLLFLLIVSTLFSFRRSGFVTLRWFNWQSLFNIFSRLPKTTTTTLPASLINDEQHVQDKMNAFLKNNPNANENYARDVVYHDIAIEEKNQSICEQIKSESLKKDCNNFFKVAG